jgi:hypothetical protein
VALNSNTDNFNQPDEDYYSLLKKLIIKLHKYASVLIICISIFSRTVYINLDNVGWISHI